MKRAPPCASSTNQPTPIYQYRQDPPHASIHVPLRVCSVFCTRGLHYTKAGGRHGDKEGMWLQDKGTGSKGQKVGLLVHVKHQKAWGSQEIIGPATRKRIINTSTNEEKYFQEVLWGWPSKFGRAFLEKSWTHQKLLGNVCYDAKNERKFKFLLLIISLAYYY